MQTLPDARPDVAVSLCSAFLGFHSHAGFLHGLAEGGVWPGHIAGASSGALVAALTASGMAPLEIFELLQSQRFRWSFFEWGMLVGSAFFPIHPRQHSGGIRGHAITRYLRGIFGTRRIEECDMRLGLAITNLTALRAEIRTEGPLAETVVASCACPGVISHQILGGEALWDGGIAQSPPLSHWQQAAPVRHILVHEVGVKTTPKPESIGLFKACALAHDVVVAELLALRLEKMLAAGKSVTSFRTAAPKPGIIVSEKTGRICFQLGYESGRRAADSLRANLAQAAA
jgi:NTE family protein